MDTVALVTADFPLLRREQMWNAMQRLVLNGLSSPHTRRAYSQALEVFVIWFCSEPGRLFTKAVVQEYRVVLERKGLSLARTDLESRLAGTGVWRSHQPGWQTDDPPVEFAGGLCGSGHCGRNKLIRPMLGAESRWLRP